MLNLGAIRGVAEREYARLRADLVREVASTVRAEIVDPGRTSRAGTVRELVGQYVAAADITPRTRVDYADRLAWLSRRFGSRTVADLEAERVESAARSEGWTVNTRRQTLAVVQGFVRWCRRTDFTVRIPPCTSRGDDAILSQAEFARLVVFAPGDYGPLFRLLWQTGARPGEGCGLTAEVVDWAGGTAKLRTHKTARKGKSRILYLTPESLALLAGQRERYGGGVLFRGRVGQRLTPRRAQTVFASCCERAGVVGRTLYSLRHSYATRALESGMSDSDVAALLGHSGTAMIHRFYSHLGANARRLREVAGRLAG